MKQVLIYQSAGQYEKNKHFRECLRLKAAFEKIGISCKISGPGYLDTGILNPDLVIYLENSHFDWIPRNKYKCPSAIWAIDAHYHGVNLYEMLRVNTGADIILHATPDFVVEKYHFWLPNCFCDQLIQKRESVKKEHNIGFCGNYANRGPFIDFIDQFFPIKRDIFVIGDDMVNAVNSYWINLNKNISVDINYRTFETIGCGTVLLTNYSLFLSKLGFENHKNCLIYETKEDALNLLEHYVNNKEALLEIGQAGFELSKNHTYQARAEYIAKIFNLK